MKYDCIIVLGNEMDKVGNLNEESTARVELAVESFKNKVAGTMVVCGWDYRKDSNIRIADAMKSYAVSKGIPANNILTEVTSRDTVGDAFFTKKNLVKPNSWRNLLVVTSDYHVNRTTKIFQFIYGNDFSIEVIGAGDFDDEDKQFSEQISLDAFHKTFENVTAGKDVEIYQALSTKHPFYNETIYPKIGQISYMQFKILFLGPADSPVFNWLLNQGEDVSSTTKKISRKYILGNQYNFLISYGYRHLLKKDVLDLFINKAINLHISYLPYNRGADPNFWSFIENTPSGVTIHYLDEGVDTGDIIVQKKMVFETNKETLSSSYQKLQEEIQNMFYENWDLIKSMRNDRKPQVGEGTVHRLKDKEPLLHLIEKEGWDTMISTLVNYNNKKNL